MWSGHDGPLLSSESSSQYCGEPAIPPFTLSAVVFFTFRFVAFFVAIARPPEMRILTSRDESVVSLRAAIMGKDVTNRSAGLAFIVCLVAMTSACAPRTTPPVAPLPQPGPPSPEPPVSPAPVPEPPAPLPPPVAPPPAVGSAKCALIAEPGERIATVALSDRIDPANAPRPSNESERVLFRQLYETLVRIDCEGRVAPALADSWRLSVDGRTWVVTLRPDAHFSDGVLVTASTVLAGFTRDGAGGELLPHVNRLVQSIVTIDDRTLAITPRSQRQDAPLVLAHTDLAIARPVSGSSWPLGTRSTRIASDRETVVVSTTTDDSLSIRFILAAGDPRDRLDQGVDLLLTRDPATLDYAATLPQFQSVPLAWQRTYVLLTPGRTRTSPSLSEEARQAIANDAIRGEARGAVGPFWWQTLQDCEVPASQPGGQSSSTGRVVYDAADSTARDLAERFVGLANASSPGAAAILDAIFPDRSRPTSRRATGLTAEALAVARRRGTDAGYIASIDRRPLDPCRELQVLVNSVRWLDPETVVPLVDTRLRAIVRRGRSGVAAEWDGGLLIGEVDAR